LLIQIALGQNVFAQKRRTLG